MNFRHSAGFGKRIEYWVLAKMLKEGLDLYVPLVDDFGIDAVLRKEDGSFVEIQIKARSKSSKLGDGARFSAISHDFRPNYFFVFYSEKLEQFWIMSSEDFIKEASQNKTGNNKGKRSICFNGCKTNRETKKKYEYSKPRYNKYQFNNFDTFK